MDILIDRSPAEKHEGSFVTEDLRLCLQAAMKASLDEAVQRGWYDRETAETEYVLWQHQFDE